MAVAGTLKWYLHRLAVMSPAEVVHRIREQGRRHASKRQVHGWAQFDVGDGPLIVLGPLRRLAGSWPEQVASKARDAVRATELTFLGQTWPEGTPIGGKPELWITDPVSGQTWPGVETFCFDVAWRREKQKGDVKLVLELNRLQFLQALCATAIRDGDRATAIRAGDLVLEWMEANPPYRGINWLSMIELSMRLVSVAFVIAALQATGEIDGYRLRLRQFVAAHAHWLHRFPSLHSSANNHRVAEGLGLLVAAELMPDAPEARRYRREGLSIMADAASSQFHNDGTGVEQSPTYAAFTLEMILLGQELGRAAGEPLDVETEARIARAARCLRTFVDVAGQAPRIGDDDEGRVFAWPPLHEERYVASVVAAAAGVLHRPDLTPPAREAHLRDVLFSAPAAEGTLENGIVCFETGGYTVVHESIAGQRLFAVVDHGPLGLPPLAAHGHSDALALWLHLDGQPVLVDAGTYRYHSMHGWREWLRSTAAHNTLAIDGASQSISAGPFNWRNRAQCRLLSLRRGETWELTAEQDGYLSRYGVTHRRSVGRLGRVLSVTDTLTGAPVAAPVLIGFLIHPDLEVIREGAAIVIRRGDEALLRVSGSSGLPEVISGALRESNAFSGRYNHLAPATRVIFRPKVDQMPHQVHLELFEASRAR